MSAARKVTTKSLQAECDRFNRFAPVGRTIDVEPGPLFGGKTQAVTINDPGAYLINGKEGPKAVVSVSGGFGHVPLSAVRFGKHADG